LGERVILDGLILPRNAMQSAARTRSRLALFVTSVMAVVIAACAPVQPGATVPARPRLGLPSLSWIGEFTRPSGASYPLIQDAKRFGSLSGLARDAASPRWMAVIDDRDGSRVAWLDITVTDGRLDVYPLGVQVLKPGSGVPARSVTQADLESIVGLPDGSFLLGEEGHTTRAGVWPPAILQVTREGVVTGVVSYPDEFQLAADGRRGTRDNQGFESLARLPSGRLIAGLEQPLSDQPVTSFDHGGEGRLIEFEPAGTGYRAGRQWRYDISPIDRVPGFPNVCSDGENGLVELLALTETTLLALERACLQNASRIEVFNPIHVYLVTLSGQVAKKTLLLDLSALAPRLSPSLSRLENFEGLGYGPPVNGRPTLLVMSDDNFRSSQVTSFLLFGMR
jgi:hypothetical protein